jgi:subtilisin family serine protease
VSRFLSQRGQHNKFLLSVALAALLSACATDGTTTGGGTGTTPPVGGGGSLTPSNVDYNTAEYRANWGLGAVNAIAAYQAGASGAGITVAVIDSGLDIDHPEFVGHYDPASINIADSANASDINDTDGHGTLVSGIIAAKKNDSGVHGVAYDANLLEIRTDQPGTCASTDGCSFLDSDIAHGVDYAIAHGAKVINLSLGGDQAANFTLAAALNRAVQQGAVIVIAAGNDYDATAGTGNDPTPFAQYADQAGANGQAIIAGAAIQTKQIADFSNRAGNSQSVYMLAPGYRINTTYNNGGYTQNYGGTSLATPHIVGAVALMMQAFPNLTAQQIVQLLLDTATDIGAAGPDAINGMGFLNIEAAFAPQGTLTISASPQTVSSGGTAQSAAFAASLMSLGPAFGDALSAGSGAFDAIGLDSYNRAYTVDLGTRVTHLSQDGLWSRNLIGGFKTAWASQRLGSSVSLDAVTFNANVDAPVWHGLDNEATRQGLVGNRGRVSSNFALGKSARWTLTTGTLGQQALSGNDRGASFLTGLSNSAPYLSLVEQGTGVLQSVRLHKTVQLVTSIELGKRRSRIGQDDIGTTAAVTGLRFAERNWAVMPKAGFVKERGGILGGSSVGLFQLDSTALTRFVGLEADLAVNRVWSLHADGTAGWTSVDGAQGLWSGFSTITTSSFRLFASGDGLLERGDRFTFGVGQPLRVESGRADVVLPTAYDYGTGSLSYTSAALTLAPTGREIDLEAVYAWPLGNGWSARANLVHRRDAGHIAGLTDNAAALQFHVGW